MKRKFQIHPFVYFFVTTLYLEIVIKMTITNHIIDSNFIYMLIFTLPFILLLTILTKSFNKIINKILLFVLTLLITIYFEVQYIFFNLFSVPFSFSTIA